MKIQKTIIQQGKLLIVFDDMIADMESNKTVTPIVTGFFIRGRKPNFFLGFISQFCFEVLKDVRLNATHYFFMKKPNKR